MPVIYRGRSFVRRLQYLPPSKSAVTNPVLSAENAAYVWARQG